MDKDASFFFSIDRVMERKIYFVDDFAPDIVGHGDVPRQHGRIVDVYNVPKHTSNLLSVSELTKIVKIMDFFPDQFLVIDLKKG